MDVNESTAARQVADVLLGYNFAPWYFGDTVGLEGLMCASELLEDPHYEGFVHGLARGAMARDSTWRDLDITIPGKVLTEVAVRRGDEVLLSKLGSVAAALCDRPRIQGAPISLQRAALMEPYGGAPLTAEETALVSDPGPAIYVDCLHFEPPFLVSFGKATGNSELVEDGVAMAEAFVELLQHDGSGLFDHFYLADTSRTYINGWTRGQGWAIFGLLDIIETIGPDSPRANALRGSAQALSSAMVACQRSDGHWGSLADEMSPQESSASAFFAAALLRMDRLGIATPGSQVAAHAALDAATSCIDEAGRVRGVSATVFSSTQIDHYRHVPIDFVVPWGQGPVLMALWEARLAREAGR